VSEYRTVRDYIEFLASGYFLLIVYFWRPDSDSNAISKDKKIYFGDPLMSSVVQQRTPGLRADPAALVENAVALALYRRYEPPEHQFQGFVAPRRLHVWGTAAGGEIDFVCGPRNALEVLEVKFRRRIDGRSLNAMTRSLPGRPIVVATKGELAFRDDLVLVPASLLLWALA
jgi:predicted AAA+ superfamily ATPase